MESLRFHEISLQLKNELISTENDKENLETL